MNCDICMETNVGPEHDITEKHIKNKVLSDYLLNRKQYAGNRKGIEVTCNVIASFKSLARCVEAKIKVSAKPNQEVTFNFTIANASKKDDFMVIFVQMVHTKFNFFINDHGMGLGCTPLSLKPKTTLQKEISIKFKSSHIGQYQMPIIFCFRKKATDENVVIMRDMVVYVEEKQTMHEKKISPYAHKEVWAKHIFKSPKIDQNNDMFRIPKNYKPIYACALKMKDDAPQDQLDLAADIRDIFATGVTKENYIRYFHNLLWYEETIVRINLKKYNMSAVPLTPQGDAFALLVPGLSEKRPSLLMGDLLFIKPHDNDDEVMFEAKISDIRENMISIRDFHTEFYKYYNPSARFDVRFFMSRMPLERMHNAVHSVAQEGQETRTFPVANTKIRKTKPIVDYFNHLVERNVEQRSVVEHILAGSSGTAPYLLHGPPGTGKTVTIVEAILQLVKSNPKNRILVCTDSNMAADHVAMMLIKYTHMFEQENLLLRASSKYRVWDTLPESLIPYSNGKDRDSFEPVSISDFKSYNIVITTLSHAAKFAKLKTLKMKRSVTHLFIDEAAQASEPACLIPTCGLLATGGLLALAGDPHQLGPVIISHNASKLGLGLSLMERLKKTCPLYSDERNDPNYMVMLRNNFRSNPDILEIPNNLFYKNQLRPLASIDPISNVDILTGRMNSRSVIFHGVLSKEQKMGKSPSYFNNMELEIVQKYISALVIKHKVLLDDIGIVTPYIRQVYQMKSWLQNKGYDKVEVGTVEAFQGKEKRIIIISTVRANCGLLDHDAKFQLGFLVDDKRFNVALTRAKAKAIVIGNPLCLQKDVKWRSYIQKCRESGTYLGFDSEQANCEEAQKEMVERIIPVLKDLKVNKKSRV